MQFEVLLLILTLLSTSPSVYCDESSERNYSELMRLQAAMGLSSFPSPSKDRIQLWMQESHNRGKLRTADRDEWRVSWTVSFFAADPLRNDLKNIAVISDSGKSVRFVDPRKENLAVSRGDVIAILLADHAK